MKYFDEVLSAHSHELKCDTFLPPFDNIIRFTEMYDEDDWNKCFVDVVSEGTEELVLRHFIDPWYGDDQAEDFSISKKFDRENFEFEVTYKNFYEYEIASSDHQIRSFIAEKKEVIRAKDIIKESIERQFDNSLNCFKIKLKDLDEPKQKKVYATACFEDLELIVSRVKSCEDKFQSIVKSLDSFMYKIFELCYPYFDELSHTKFPFLRKSLSEFYTQCSGSQDEELEFFTLKPQKRENLFKALSKQYIHCSLLDFEGLLNLDGVTNRVRWHGKPIEFVAFLFAFYDANILKKKSSSIKWKYWEQNILIDKHESSSPKFSKIKQNIKLNNGEKYLLYFQEMAKEILK
ncbi:MAG: hypothetical protein ACJAX3_001610 [Patiriisocius sp.]|jgi:hypothetical protein